MIKRQTCVLAICLSTAMLMACGDNNAEMSEIQVPETVSSEPATYGINTTSMENNAGSDYEISDMLPAPDEMLVISLEDAEALMNKNANNGAGTEELRETGDKTSLVVYFSRAENIAFDADVDAVTSASINLDDSGNPVGNLRLLAEYISEETGAEIFSIRTASLYPTGYTDTTDQATEEKDRNARPNLSTHVDNMDDYDVIFLGYPIWWGTLPMPVVSFLEEYDFTGKTIVPFSSHEGSGLGSGVSMIRELCPDAEVQDGFAVKGSEVSTDKGKQVVADFIAGL